MKPEDKNLDKALSEDDLDAVSGGAYARSSGNSTNDSPLTASISVCSAQNANNGADALALNNK